MAGTTGGDREEMVAMLSAGLAMLTVSLGALLFVVYGGALEPEHEEEPVERIMPGQRS